MRRGVVMEMSLSFGDIEGGDAQGREKYDGSITDGKCMTGLHTPGGYSWRDSMSWV